MKIVYGDFGMLMCSKWLVLIEIGECFMLMLMLMFVSMVWLMLFGMVIGIVLVVWCNCWFDCFGMMIVVLGILFFVFVFGMLLMEVFLVKFGWLLVVLDGLWKSYVLLLLMFGVVVVVVMVCFMCVLFVEVLNEDFVCIVCVKGVCELMVVFKYCLCNVMILVVMMMGL